MNQQQHEQQPNGVCGGSSKLPSNLLHITTSTAQTSNSSSSSSNQRGPAGVHLAGWQPNQHNNTGSDSSRGSVRPRHPGPQHPGVIDCILEVVSDLPDASAKRSVLENVLLCGGGACIPGISGRVVSSLAGQLPSGLPASLCQVPEYMLQQTPQYVPYLGGAVMAKMVAYQNHFMIKAEYERSGRVLCTESVPEVAGQGCWKVVLGRGAICPAAQYI